MYKRSNGRKLPITLCQLNSSNQPWPQQNDLRTDSQGRLIQTSRTTIEKLLRQSIPENRLDSQQLAYHLGRCDFAFHLFRVALLELQKHPNKNRFTFFRHQRRAVARVAFDACPSICSASGIDHRSVCLPYARWTGARFGFLPQIQINIRSNS